MLCLVLKGFNAAGEDLIPGQLIDASEYRNREKLISARYMRMATSQEVASAVEVTEERAMRIRRKKQRAN